MSAAVDKLVADEAALAAAVQSAVALLNTIPGLIAEAGTDPAALAALSTKIEADTAAITTAVTADTPSPAQAAS